MKKVLPFALLSILTLVLMTTSCGSSYKSQLENQIKAGEVFPLSLDEATRIQNQRNVVTFHITNKGISSNAFVNIDELHKGENAEVVYLIINERDIPIEPYIYYGTNVSIENCESVNGQGYVDAPFFTRHWVSISPDTTPIQPDTAQGHIVTFKIPKDSSINIKKRIAFQIGVAFGETLQLAAAPWWLITIAGKG